MNTPGRQRHAMTQSDHEVWNSRHFPGTRQLCEQCGEPTERCEDDSLYADEIGPLCVECWNTANLGYCDDQLPRNVPPK